VEQSGWEVAPYGAEVQEGRHLTAFCIWAALQELSSTELI